MVGIGFFDEVHLIIEGPDLSLPEKFSSRSFANFELILSHGSVGNSIAEIRGGRNFTLDFDNFGNQAVCNCPSIFFLSQRKKVLENSVELSKNNWSF